jgi:hypothetical protein
VKHRSLGMLGRRWACVPCKPRRSKTCFRKREPRRGLAEYWGEREAQAAAQYATARHGLPFVVRRCDQCPRFHIEPKREYCPSCTGSDGKVKRFYRTPAEAAAVAHYRGGNLWVYTCPLGGYHLTKSRP